MQSFFPSNLQNGIALLIDPEKVHGKWSVLATWCDQINHSGVDFVFVGGSTVSAIEMAEVCAELKKQLAIPLIIFPGGSHQLSADANGILLLNLISGDNPDFLIGHHRLAAHQLWESNLQIFSTSYLLIDGGKTTKVQQISNTKPILHSELDRLSSTLKAGRMIGHQLCYLEAGSGAINTVPSTFVNLAKSIYPFVITGGGIRSVEAIREKHQHGANLVVIGNHLEENPEFISEIKKYKESLISND